MANISKLAAKLKIYYVKPEGWEEIGLTKSVQSNRVNYYIIARFSVNLYLSIYPIISEVVCEWIKIYKPFLAFLI